MSRLFVAGQNQETREWILVAELTAYDDGYSFHYTRGAQRLPSFQGIGLMQALEETYYSRTLFPFFRNRLLSKSRPEYKSYLRWLGLEGFTGSSMEVLSVTGGARATDSYELVAMPEVKDGMLSLSFFPRGLRYLPESTLSLLMQHKEGERLLLLRDIQNPMDKDALSLRTEQPSAILVGYIPRYYCQGIHCLLENDVNSVKLKIKKLNLDAPLDMKVLIEFEVAVPNDFDILKGVNDANPLTKKNASESSELILSKTDLQI